ncbi:hypothetical protein [Deinococcus soli (ex Cha et al. 2016)]|uniref:Uncharacterized protein n=2 Tax=Deinococcus soli (ex Cha et al. 2016) TaxID=1309411 RepID=A0ACC6KL15_9DEIO|nr:hypothetical protein [Deinococcus soli (ex Cha et al. 2016)]MDR6218707.1 hypothetical protein [Deinococcus soli (ex Cha et al. 2016)]MDR6328504.1 hypothetical protein [Deinococcus soli (ex Cha et al. 2016)]MDR6753115.1 hypothetical protein [Deinococcus soli (ex Cha et al. 2016)]
MSPHTISSGSVHVHGTLVFVGDPHLAAHVAERRGGTTTVNDVRVQAFDSGTVRVNGHPLKPLAARALAGLLGCAAHSDQPGQAAGVTIDVPEDGVILLTAGTSVTPLDGQGALDLADLLTRAAQAAERRAPRA